MSISYTTRFLVDFNAMDRNGCVPATTKYCYGPRPQVGCTVLLDDCEDLTAYGEVVMVRDNLFRVRIEKHTMRSRCQPPGGDT